MFELLNDEVIKMQHENISTSDLRANESLAFTWSPFRLSRNKCSTWGYSFVCASNEQVSVFIFFSPYSLAGSISWSLICFTHDSTLSDGKRHIVGASQEIDCTGACWLNARLKYFLPQQILSVFPHLIHQTSTEMDRRMEWCSRLLFHDSTDKRFAQLSAEL